ncbi:hypothetical protein [Sphingobacterium faecium]|uniref:hypothetical protein n=1 Tax=Sphingobacterium faecium TaxID=34087 RepID=UPI003208E0B8
MKDEEKKVVFERTEIIEIPNFKSKSRGRKVTLTDESVKRYKVTVRYIEVSDEERKIKRAIIKDIMKKTYKK